MKDYKCISPFNSPSIGNVNINDKVTISEAIGDKMTDFLEPVETIETKPVPKVAKETKPKKVAKKATK